jgi:hypothetical protein
MWVETLEMKKLKRYGGKLNVANFMAKSNLINCVFRKENLELGSLRYFWKFTRLKPINHHKDSPDWKILYHMRGACEGLHSLQDGMQSENVRPTSGDPHVHYKKEYTCRIDLYFTLSVSVLPCGLSNWQTPDNLVKHFILEIEISKTMKGIR